MQLHYMYFICVMRCMKYYIIMIVGHFRKEGKRHEKYITILGCSPSCPHMHLTPSQFSCTQRQQNIPMNAAAAKELWGELPPFIKNGSVFTMPTERIEEVAKLPSLAFREYDHHLPWLIPHLFNQKPSKTRRDSRTETRAFCPVAL